MNFNINNLSEKEMNTILQALSNMPYNQVAELIHKIQTQGTEQLTNVEK